MDQESNTVFIAKTTEGLEDVLAEELRQLGGLDIEILKRGVRFSGTKELMYKSNYLCRTALRILMPIDIFSAPDEQTLYNGITRIPWEKYMSVDQTLAVDGVVNSSGLTHSHYVALKAKDAIADRFRSKFNKRPNVDTENPHLRVNIHIYKDECTVSLDSSGSSLHLRGYRKAVVPAPLSEVLAAGLVLLSGWDKKSPLLDPMCGSGTILIEAAMLALNIPSGTFRDHFGFMEWPDYDSSLWNQIKKQAEEAVRKESLLLKGSDVDLRAVRIARQNIAEAGLERVIQIERKAFLDATPSGPNGMIITNPPYGQRMGVQNQVQFYMEIGDILKTKFPGYTAWFLSADLENLKFIGLRPNRKIKLFNGPLECRFARFELYAGSKKTPGQGNIESTEVINE